MAVYEGILETCIRITEGGDTRITEAGDIRLLEYDGETVFSVDSIASIWAAQVAIDESVGVSDSSPVLWDAQVAIDESIGVYDNVLVEVSVAIDESVGVSDSSPVLWDAQGFFAELVSINDSVSATWNAQVELSESVSLSDTYVLARVYGKILNELISASDVLSVDWNAQGATDELISASDVLSVDWNAQVELSESVFIDDSAPVAWNIQEVLTESIAAGDNILVEISVAIDESVLVSDAISVSGYIIGCWLTIEGNDTFQVGDILYIKEGLDAEWLEVTDITFAPSYKVTRDKAGVYADGANPQWTKGASIVNYGQAGDGGIYLTASDTNAPHLSIFTHNGAPWNSITTHIREGNLNGYAGYETDIYGWASYIDADNYITIDPANGIRMSGEIVITGGSGITLLSDAGDLVTANDLDDVPNGTNYGRVATTAISAGKIVLSETIGNLDDIADGTNYGKVASTAISAGKIILTETIGNLDDIADGDSYGRVATTAISAGKIILTNGTGVGGILPKTYTEADVTAENTAAAITGQGALATKDDIAEGDLQSPVLNRMFLDAETKANIEAWRKAGSPTYLDGEKIYSQSIVGDKIVAGTLTADKMNVDSIIAAGNILVTGDADKTSTVISGGLVTSGAIQSSNFDSSHGMKIDLTNAQIIVNEPGGLVINSDAFVRLEGIIAQQNDSTFSKGSFWLKPFSGISGCFLGRNSSDAIFFSRFIQDPPVQSGEEALVWTSDALYDYVNNTLETPFHQKSLGTADYLWSEVWADDGTINTSDKTKKKDIVDTDLGLDFICRLSAKKWSWKWGKRPHYGLISQEVGEVLNNINQDFAGYIKADSALIEKEDGDTEWVDKRILSKNAKILEERTSYHIRYHEFIGPIVKAIQELNQKIKSLKKERK